MPVEPLVQAFRSHAPEHLPAYPVVRAALARLRARCPIGLVHRRDSGIQRAKLRALGLCDAFDVVVLSDELGRQHRKPHSAPSGLRWPGSAWTLGRRCSSAITPTRTSPAPLRQAEGTWREGMSLEGPWYNELGSTMQIYPLAGNGSVSGTYETAVSSGCAQGAFNLAGRTDVGQGGQTVGFSVCWLNQRPGAIP
jgi:hypothetical protein